MTSDRIKRLTIKGMRSIRDVTLDLDGLTVLIGENGAGKSTTVEAFQLLRKACLRGSTFLVDVVGNFHGGLESLLRLGDSDLTLAVMIEGTEPRMEYGFRLGLGAKGPEVRREWLKVWAKGVDAPPLQALDRDEVTVRYFDQSKGQIVALDEPPAPLALVAESANTTFAQSALRRLGLALEAIEVHCAFDTRPRWATTAPVRGTMNGIREQITLETAERLNAQGTNLANRLHTIRDGNSELWRRFIDLAALGLGEDLRDIMLPARDPGSIGMQLRFATIPAPVPASGLSDGQLSYLAFLALAITHQGQSVVVLDEPETHFHPELVGRVTWMLEDLGRSCPVVVATHSDAFLDALTEPASSAVLYSLDGHRATIARRVDAGALAKWLERYRGLGQLRTEGYERQVFRSAAREA